MKSSAISAGSFRDEWNDRESMSGLDAAISMGLVRRVLRSSAVARESRRLVPG